MTGGLRVAGEAMGNFAKRHEIISNNLANVSTDGFARQESFFERMTAASAAPVSAPRVGTRTDLRPGPTSQTGNPLDVAIDGAGFFSVKTDRGERFSRLGSFLVDSDGMLRNSLGYIVLGEKGAMHVGDKPVSIDSDGSVLVDGQVLDRLKMTVFASGGDLSREAAGLYAAREDVVPKDAGERPTVSAGQLESSSVQPVTELVRMISALRSYEAAASAIKSTDRTIEMAVSDVGKV